MKDRLFKIVYRTSTIIRQKNHMFVSYLTVKGDEEESNSVTLDGVASHAASLVTQARENGQFLQSDQEGHVFDPNTVIDLQVFEEPSPAETEGEKVH